MNLLDSLDCHVQIRYRRKHWYTQWTAIVAVMAAMTAATNVAAAVHDAQLTPSASAPVIRPDIFGQFAEMLGEGIYGGIWVGKNSTIPNIRGIRTDVVQALRELHVPNVRWPGGCYADQYHWRDGIGEKRRARLNANWGGVIDDNSFGTHEFMDFVEQIGSNAYISINIGSGTVQEAADWLEYMTSDKPTGLAQERAANGRSEPWKVKFLGLGNESWGCGGMFKAEEYAEKMRQYGSMVKSFHPEQRTSFLATNPNAMVRIGVGEGLDQTSFTEAVMKSWQMGQPFFTSVDALSLHYYTGSMLFDDSTQFGEREYAQLLQQTYLMEKMIAQHASIMDRFDPQKKVPLAIDEWGAWLKPLPGTQTMFLRQQNSMRDAIIASINLNIFARHADRVGMANIAQMVNVIQSMILTDGPRMVRTPTYHVFRMYVPFQGATLIPVSMDRGTYAFGDVQLPQVDAIAARAKDGTVWVAAANLDANQSLDVRLRGLTATGATGHTLTADKVNAVNTYDAPDVVFPKNISTKATGGVVTLHLPAKSVTVVQLEGVAITLTAAARSPAKFSTSTTPSGVLIAYPPTRAILDRYLPTFSNGALGPLKDLPLRQIRMLAPVMLNERVLDQIDAALATVPADGAP